MKEQQFQDYNNDIHYQDVNKSMFSNRSDEQEKIDPKVKKLAQRDMELAHKKREALENQRKTEKEWRKGRHTECYSNQKSKKRYGNVESKIKNSVRMDRSK